jgi:hypothetical protein
MTKTLPSQQTGDTQELVTLLKGVAIWNVTHRDSDAYDREEFLALFRETGRYVVGDRFIADGGTHWISWGHETTPPPSIKNPEKYPDWNRWYILLSPTKNAPNPRWYMGMWSLCEEGN